MKNRKSILPQNRVISVSAKHYLKGNKIYPMVLFSATPKGYSPLFEEYVKSSNIKYL
jgi:hypothetical protein